jgi:dolichol-phosphate hexosyltransferase
MSHSPETRPHVRNRSFRCDALNYSLVIVLNGIKSQGISEMSYQITKICVIHARGRRVAQHGRSSIWGPEAGVGTVLTVGPTANDRGRGALADRTPTPTSDPEPLPHGGIPPATVTVPHQHRTLARQGERPPSVGWPGSPMRFGQVKLSILMPAYNEERTVAWVIDEILGGDYPCDFELIVVDDGSTDRTPTLLSNIDDPRLRLIRHSVNRGKGAALLSAAAQATGTHVLPFDADFEYEPADIPRLLEPMLRGRCEVVYGVRLFGCNTVYHSYKYAVGNRWLTRCANIMFDSYLSDLHTCLKLMPLSMFRRLQPTETGFGLDTEITALLLRQGVRPFEVPVSYYSRSRAQGKKITWRDALHCLRILVRERLARPGRRGTVPPVAGQPAAGPPVAGPQAAGDPVMTNGEDRALHPGHVAAFTVSGDDDDELATAAP